MAILEVTSRRFRESQRAMFELADKGEKIVIKRGSKQAYVLTPVDDDDDLYFTPEMLEKIDRSLQEAKEGKVIAMQPGETLDDFLNRFVGCIE